MKLLTSVVLLATGAIAAWVEKPVQEDQPFFPPNGFNYPAQAPEQNSTYEYIIVGSGAGGSPLAARLALAGHSVLLIDAGEDHGTDRQVQIPAMHPFASEYTPIRWDFFVERHEDEEQALRDTKYTWQTPDGEYWSKLLYSNEKPPQGSVKKGLLYPRTGALGGCTVHNAQLMVQATKKDWNDIAELTGDSSWSSKTMDGYFKKLERNEYIQGSLLNPNSHGTKGWLPTRLTPATLIAQDLKIVSLLLAACSATGKGLVSGLLGTVGGALSALSLDVNTMAKNRDVDDILYQMPLSMNSDYIRTGPRDFVLEVAMAKNKDGSKKYKLDIALNTLVTKVNFDQSGDIPQAVGVDYIFGKSLYRADPRASTGSAKGTEAGTINASREVIVSGGAFNTPQILKLSGVGPAEELKAHGIPVVKDLPGVGGNLQDRYEVGVVAEAPDKFALLKECTFLHGDDPCYNKWKSGSIGELKGSYPTNGIAWGYLKHSSTSGSDHDLWIGGSTAYFNGYFPGYSKHATEGGNFWTFLTLKAHSRNNAGSVNLTSADPRDTPAIHFRNFEKGGEEDIQAVVEGMKYSIDAYDKLVPLDGSFDRVWPPKNISSDAELRQFVKDEAWGHHASCTAPIGADDDPLAVLDSKFRVRGVKGLRVVDASAFPKIPGFFIALPTFTLSEKAADVIIKDAAASS